VTSTSWENIAGRIDSLKAGLILLSDPHLEIIASYGLTRGTLGLDLARPGAFLVDPNGLIKWRGLPKSWRHRLNSQEVLNLYTGKENQ